MKHASIKPVIRRTRKDGRKGQRGEGEEGCSYPASKVDFKNHPTRKGWPHRAAGSSEVLIHAEYTHRSRKKLQYSAVTLPPEFIPPIVISESSFCSFHNIFHSSWQVSHSRALLGGVEEDAGETWKML